MRRNGIHDFPPYHRNGQKRTLAPDSLWSITILRLTTLTLTPQMTIPFCSHLPEHILRVAEKLVARRFEWFPKQIVVKQQISLPTCLYQNIDLHNYSKDHPVSSAYYRLLGHARIACEIQLKLVLTACGASPVLDTTV